MKFPKSMHPEGWIEQLESGSPRRPAASVAKPGSGLPRAGAKIGRDEPLFAGAEPTAPVQPAPFAAPAGTTPTPAPRASVSPWVIGAGAGIALIALAVSMSRTLSPSDAAPPPVVTGQVQPAQQPSPEDAQLAAAPAAAGPLTQGGGEQAVASEPAAAPAPVLGPPVTTVAAAPASPPPPKAAAPKVEAPSPTPVAKTLSPKPETLAQASPPPVSALNEPAPAVPPAALPTPVPPPAATPEATPVPPVAQQQPQPPVADPEDTGITVKVRQALAADAVLAAVPIAVSTDHGVVKLEGQAPDAQAREHATVVVASTLGVKGVDNRLTLPPVAQLQFQPRSELQDS